MRICGVRCFCKGGRRGQSRYKRLLGDFCRKQKSDCGYHGAKHRRRRNHDCGRLPRRKKRRRQVRIHGIRQLQKYGIARRRKKTMQVGLPRHGFMRGFLSVQRNASGRGRLCASGQRKMRRLRKMHQLLPQTPCQENSCHGKVLCGMFELSQRSKGSACRMHGGMPRMRTLRKGLSKRRNHASEQSCRHRLFKMHRLRNMRIEVPVKVYFANTSARARQVICKSNLGE